MKKQSWSRWITRALLMELAVLSWVHVARATDIVSPANVNSPSNPTIQLTQTGDEITPTPPYEWRIVGNHANFVIWDIGTGYWPHIEEQHPPDHERTSP
jgi:hypothetical protein